MKTKHLLYTKKMQYDKKCDKGKSNVIIETFLLKDRSWIDFSLDTRISQSMERNLHHNLLPNNLGY